MRVVYTPDHLLHDISTEVEWGVVMGNFEQPVRAEVIRARLADDPSFGFVAPASHGRGPVDAVHDPAMVSFLERVWREFNALESRREIIGDSFLHPALREGMGPAPEPALATAAVGYWSFETMTPIVEGTYAAARAAVDVALTAAASVLDGDRVAYALCRPPGHHAPRAAFGGYCFFNNAAITANWLVGRGAARVTVLDVDYHHGNGTQQIFYGRDDVQYVSLHGDPNRAYPYFAGHADETGAGRGLGTTLNLPLPVDADDDAYLAALDVAVDAIDAFDPAVVVLSLGVDTFEHDPITDLRVTTEGFAVQAARVRALDRPVVVVQEGGYHVRTLGENVWTWLTGLDGGG